VLLSYSPSAARRAPLGERTVVWADESTWWHIYPLGFVGAPIRGADPAPGSHRLRRLLPWLDYAVDLGVTGLILGPVFDSTSHGYDTLNHYRIDPRLGDDRDFADLMSAATERGLKIVLDGVFNHVGDQHPWFTEVLAEGQDSRRADLFAIDWTDPGHPVPTVFEGHPQLVEFNHGSAAAVDLVADVMRYWLGKGIAGWRLDAAYAVPLEFWAEVLPAVREDYPDAWFLGEVIHGDYPNIVDLSTMDTVTQYRLWKATWSSLAEENFYELDWCLREHSDDFGTHFVPQTFVGNHDVTRVATRTGAAKAPLAAVVLLTVNGTPSIYYGDERGYQAVKEDREGGDDAVRPAYPESPAEFGDDGWGMFAIHKDLIAIRNRHPWLARSRKETLELENKRYVYRVSDPEGDGSLVVEMGMGDEVYAQIADDGEVLFSYRA
jgi:glycosidase